MALSSRPDRKSLSTVARDRNGVLHGSTDDADKNVTKRQLVQAVAERTGLGKYEVQRMFEALMDQVTEEIGRGRRIEIRDFGVYEVKVRSGRTAQNPKTLEPVPVPPKCMVRFKPGKSMRQALDELCKHVSLEESVSRRQETASSNGMPLVEVAGVGSMAQGRH